MDAHALLTSQGWRGTGHSLHPTSDLNGLSKPLLVSRKDNVLGLGKKQHRTSDMWWMNAFDSSLKGLDTSVQGQVVQTVTSGGLDMVARGGGKYVGKGGLYASFVRGECLSGTLTPEEVEVERTKLEGLKAKVDSKVVKEGGKKRKRAEEKESKEERRAKKAVSKAMGTTEDFAVKAPKIECSTGSSDDAAETKEERRARRTAKRAAKEQAAISKTIEKAQVKPVETKEERKERRRLEKLSLGDPQKEIEVEEVQITKPEKKEERKERRRLKKLAQVAEGSNFEESSEKSKKKKRRKD